MSVKYQNIMANSVDPDDTAYDEPYHQVLYCLHRYLIWSAGLQGLEELTKTEETNFGLVNPSASD